MSMYSQARACGVDPDADADRDYESTHQWQSVCNVCEAVQPMDRWCSSYVCSWCGEGVMQCEEVSR